MFQDIWLANLYNAPYNSENPIRGPSCPAGIFADTAFRKDTTNEVETMQFLEGAADYRLQSCITKSTVWKIDEKLMGLTKREAEWINEVGGHLTLEV